MKGVEIYWDDKDGIVEITGDVTHHEAAERCLNASLSLLMETGKTKEQAQKQLILSLTNSLMADNKG